MSWPPFSTQTTTRKTHLSWCHQVTEEEQKVPAELLWPQKSMAYIWMTGWTIAKVTDCRHFSEAIEISHLSLSLSLSMFDAIYVYSIDVNSCWQGILCLASC